MCVVWDSMPQRVDHQSVDSARRFLGVRGHFLAIGEIRQQLAPPAAKDQSSGCCAPMGQIEGITSVWPSQNGPSQIDERLRPNVIEKTILSFECV